MIDRETQRDRARVRDTDSMEAHQKQLEGQRSGMGRSSKTKEHGEMASWVRAMPHNPPCDPQPHATYIPTNTREDQDTRYEMYFGGFEMNPKPETTAKSPKTPPNF